MAYAALHMVPDGTNPFPTLYATVNMRSFSCVQRAHCPLTNPSRRSRSGLVPMVLDRLPALQNTLSSMIHCGDLPCSRRHHGAPLVAGDADPSRAPPLETGSRADGRAPHCAPPRPRSLPLAPTLSPAPPPTPTLHIKPRSPHPGTYGRPLSPPPSPTSASSLILPASPAAPMPLTRAQIAASGGRESRGGRT